MEERWRPHHEHHHDDDADHHEGNADVVGGARPSHCVP